MMNRCIFHFLAGLLLLGLAGCQTSGTTAGGKSSRIGPPSLARAEQLFNEGNDAEAMIECIDLGRVNPATPGLDDLQRKIVMRLAEKRAASAQMTTASFRRMEADIERSKRVPETYGTRRAVRGERAPLRATQTLMQRALEKKVTVHLDNVNLSDFILAVGASENINIVADVMDNDSTMTIHAEGVPLSEILDYVSRNMGVAFYAGNNMVWATPEPAAESGVPLDTRMYRLRKGISSEEIQDGSEIIKAIERFVPKTDGSDLLFNKQAHVLIVRNTRENLTRVEDIIEALDVCPPQILIEARFISSSISDLRELGIDWIFNTPITVTRKEVLRDGTREQAPKTQIDSGAAIGFAPFTSQAQGLNFSYRGLLTDPMFKAVLHALETSGQSRTLSVPKVTTVNNRPAVIRIGEDFRYFEEYDVQSTPSAVSDGGSQLYNSILVPVGVPSVEELGIELNVIPSVGADMGDIQLRIEPEISEFVRYEEYQVGTGTTSGTGSTTTNGTSLVKLPIFRRSRIETEVVVESGETVIMGGLINSSETKSVSGVPFLSSIPLIGRLFRHDTVQESKQNLLIFVTATILSQRGETLVPIVDHFED